MEPKLPQLQSLAHWLPSLPSSYRFDVGSLVRLVMKLCLCFVFFFKKTWELFIHVASYLNGFISLALASRKRRLARIKFV
jgi:hypothetical protein